MTRMMFVTGVMMCVTGVMCVTGEMCVTGVMFATDLVSGIKGLHDPGRARSLAGQRQGHAAQAGGVVTHVAVKLISAQVLKLLPK